MLIKQLPSLFPPTFPFFNSSLSFLQPLLSWPPFLPSPSFPPSLPLSIPPSLPPYFFSKWLAASVVQKSTRILWLCKLFFFKLVHRTPLVPSTVILLASYNNITMLQKWRFAIYFPRSNQLIAFHQKYSSIHSFHSFYASKSQSNPLPYWSARPWQRWGVTCVSQALNPRNGVFWLITIIMARWRFVN